MPAHGRGLSDDSMSDITGESVAEAGMNVKIKTEQHNPAGACQGLRALALIEKRQ